MSDGKPGIVYTNIKHSNGFCYTKINTLPPPYKPLYYTLSPPTGWINWPISDVHVSNLKKRRSFSTHTGIIMTTHKSLIFVTFTRLKLWKSFMKEKSCILCKLDYLKRSGCHVGSSFARWRPFDTGDDYII